MMHLNRSTRRRGAHVVELALTLPAFLSVMFALVDYGVYFANLAIIDAAVAEGCRTASLVDPLTGDPITEAQLTMVQFIDSVGFVNCAEDCIVEASDVGEVPARSIRCSIDLAYQPFVGFVPTPDRVGSAAVMRYEWQRSEVF